MIYRSVVAASVCSMIMACSTTSATGAADAAAHTDVLSFSGEVVYVDLEGGFFGIVTDQGKRLDPRALPESVRKDRLRVTGKANVLVDVMTFRMWGTPVDIIEIAPQ